MDASATAERLHSAAIHLLRRVRVGDVESGIGPARLSILSVLVFGGERTVTELAAAEQVRVPTMSALVRGLEADGLVRRTPDREDRRAVRLRATEKGRRVLLRAKSRRLVHLFEILAPLSRRELRTVHEAVEILERALSETGRDPAG